jgi:hypothetical protein
MSAVRRQFALQWVRFSRIILYMTRDVLETAAREGVPFVIRMADGEKYRVSSRDRIIVGNTRVVVMDDKDIPHVLPLLTMTGVSYLPRDGESAAP